MEKQKDYLIHTNEVEVSKSCAPDFFIRNCMRFLARLIRVFRSYEAMIAMKCTFQQDAEVHKYGSSPVKQRIEGWWVFYRRNI